MNLRSNLHDQVHSLKMCGIKILQGSNFPIFLISREVGCFFCILILFVRVSFQRLILFYLESSTSSNRSLPNGVQIISMRASSKVQSYVEQLHEFVTVINATRCLQPCWLYSSTEMCDFFARKQTMQVANTSTIRACFTGIPRGFI